MQIRLQGTRDNFVYESHRVKVKVTGAKKRHKACVIRLGGGANMMAPSSEYEYKL